MLKELIEKNKNLKIYSADNSEVKSYGKIVDYDFAKEIEYINLNTDMPENGVLYIPHVDGAPCEYVQKNCFGCMPVQMGICHGFNTKLNGLEYHKGSEIIVAITDLVLLVAHVYDVESDTIHSKSVMGIFLPAGTAFNMYETTMHLAPCRVSDYGFKSIIILPEGTNLPLEEKTDDKLLYMKNKWLIVHPENTRGVKHGAWVGIEGENIEIKY